MTDASRRHILQGAIGAAAAILLGTLPIARSQATLDASVRVLDAAYDHTGDIGYLTVEITNTRPPDGRAFTPVPHVWGLGRQTQMAWPPERGEYPSVAPGEVVRLTLDAPGTAQSVRLIPDKRAMVRVFARGTERRAETAFIPSHYVNQAR